MMRAARQPVIRSRRPGSAYVFILGIAVLLTVIGLSGVALVRLGTRLTAQSGDIVRAETLAETAVEYALYAIAQNTSWRTTYTSGTETAAKTLGGGTFSFKLVDEGDGSLSDDPMDNVRLYGYGRAGAAVRVYSVELKCKKVPLDVLRCAAHAAGNVSAITTSTVSGGPLSSNATLSLPSGLINGDVEAATVSNAGTITGTITSGAAAKTMPSTGLFDTYQNKATAISYWSLNYGRLEYGVLSAASNPYGSTNASGVYYIWVPYYYNLTIRNARLAATLVVYLSYGASLTTSSNLLWDAPAGQPALLIQASSNTAVDLDGASGWFAESEIGVNLNPSGTPYNGSTDSDQYDVYPCEVRGLIHSVGTSYTVDLNNYFKCRGPVICQGPMAVGGYTVLYANPALLTDPPEGYYTPGPMVPIAGTWRWVTGS